MFKEIVIHASAQWAENGTNTTRRSLLGPICFDADTEQPLKPQIDEELAARVAIRNRHHPTVQITDAVVDTALIAEEDGRCIMLDLVNPQWPEPEDESPRVIMQM